MAKEIFWYGGESTHEGEWNWDANWKLVSDGSSSTKPADDDIVHIDNRAYYDTVNERYQDINDGMDAAGTGTPDLRLLHVKPSYDGIIALPGEYLELAAAYPAGGDGQIIYEGEGTMYLDLSKGAAADASCNLLVVDTTEGLLKVMSHVNDGANTGLFDLIRVKSGDVELGDTTSKMCAFTDMEVLGGTIIVGIDCYKVNGAVYATILQVLGSITMDTGIKAMTQYGGAFNWGSALATGEAAMDIEDLLTMYGGTFNWTCKDLATSIIQQFILYGGVLDASLALNADVPKGIGGGGDEISEVWPGAEARFDNENQNITFEGASKIMKYGGTIKSPYMKEISW